MVDAVEPAVGRGQQVAALAVAVVDHGVEYGEPAQPRVVSVDEQGGAALPDLGEGDGLPALPRLLALDEREERARRGATSRAAFRGALRVTLRARRLDPLLDHALAVRSVAQHGGRHQAPSGGLGDQVGGDLALGEVPVGEIPQRALPLDRFVHAVGAHAVVRDGAQQDGVGRLTDPADDGQLALGEQFLQLPRVRHAWRR